MSIIKTVKDNYNSTKPAFPFAIISIFIVVFSTFLIYSCSENNSDKNKTGDSNDAKSESEITKINASIDNFISKLDNLPKAPQNLADIKYEPLQSRENLAFRTLEEINESGSKFTDSRSIELYNKFHDLVKEWFNTVTDYKNKLKDYEVVYQDLKEISSSPLPDRNISSVLFKKLELESDANKKSAVLLSTASKIKDMEHQIRILRGYK